MLSMISIYYPGFPRFMVSFSGFLSQYIENFRFQIIVTSDVCAENLRRIAKAHYNICAISNRVNRFFDITVVSEEKRITENQQWQIACELTFFFQDHQRHQRLHNFEYNALLHLRRGSKRGENELRSRQYIHSLGIPTQCSDNHCSSCLQLDVLSGKLGRAKN